MTPGCHATSYFLAHLPLSSYAPTHTQDSSPSQLMTHSSYLASSVRPDPHPFPTLPRAHMASRQLWEALLSKALRRAQTAGPNLVPANESPTAPIGHPTSKPGMTSRSCRHSTQEVSLFSGRRTRQFKVTFKLHAEMEPSLSDRMAYQAEVPAPKPDNLDPMPVIYTVKRENRSLVAAIQAHHSTHPHTYDANKIRKYTCNKNN